MQITDDAEVWGTRARSAPLLADSAPAQSSLPTGTITFLLTDVEGSTRLWDQYPGAMRIALKRHDEIIERAIARHVGVIVRPRGEGDSRFGVFDRATDALAAAAEIQSSLEEEAWDMPERLAVRVAVHTGEADVRAGDYYGGAVNRCARIRAVAHGGQVLISGATHDLVQDSPEGWPANTWAVSLGEHRLAGLTRPERIYQLVIAGLRRDFAPLASPEAPRHNLPAQLTTFVGRDREREALARDLLDERVRLITLCGSGGVGKTRLALQAAADVVHAFKDGAYFVSLAATRRPDLVPSAIAQALGLFERSSRSAVEQLIDRLRDQQLLLVLDNFEQVIDAAPVVTDLLRACRTLKVLATSRSLLRLSGERAMEVLPLAVPAAGAGDVEHVEAVRLFVDRVRQARWDFSLTAENADAVAEICRRVDGLPLAIELVAARVLEFSLRELNDQLVQGRLGLLTEAPRDAPARHQTLRAAIAWSCDLLDPSDRALFGRLAVFAGGFTAQMAQQVCQVHGQPANVRQGLSSLVAKSLVHLQESDDGQQRFSMLETLREYASELLERGKFQELVHEQHALAFEHLLVEAADQRFGPREAQWLRQLAEEHENLRVAIAWVLENRRADLALSMADKGWWFLLTYGFAREGIQWLEAVLRVTEGQKTAQRARVLVGASWLADEVGDLRGAERWLEEAMEIGRSTHDLEVLNAALAGLSFVVHRLGDFERGVSIAEENVAVARALQNPTYIARAYIRLGEHLVLSFDYVRGARVAEEAVRLNEQVGNKMGVAAVLDTLGLAQRLAGNLKSAATVLERSVELHRESGWKANTAEALFRWADVLVLLGDDERASAACAEGLALARESGAKRRVAKGVRVAATIANSRGDFERAASLSITAERLYAELGSGLNPVDRGDLEAVLQDSREALGHARFDSLAKFDTLDVDAIVRTAQHTLLAPSKEE